ncbi:MAG: response regulator [Gemmatimonadetes bacterium]|nr:response regulator [Gemmatimonadota bacterium]
MARVLVIDDEPRIRAVVGAALRDDVDAVHEAPTAAEGLALAAVLRPDLIVLDIGLPDRDGLSVCRELRQWTTVPIVVLSARHAEEEKATLLDAGADDYVTKPFGERELRARVRAQLRRARMHPPTEEGPLVLGDLMIDVTRRSVLRDGAAVHLTPTEWGLLVALVTNAGKTLTHRQLFRAVWGDVHGDAHQYLRVYIAHLRRKIEQDPVTPRYLITEPGVGYRLETSG